MNSSFALLSLLVAVNAASTAPAYRCEVLSFPPRVVEEEDLRIEVAYEVPEGATRLHCEVKDL
ncbi:MAG: hypothetical protein QHJ73_07450, partial [Armatimonadota bacterium]|nr:hypothetical protein [Armatimonadota bacterium]